MSAVTIAALQTAAVFCAAGLPVLWVFFWLEVLPEKIAVLVALAPALLMIFAGFYFTGDTP